MTLLEDAVPNGLRRSIMQGFGSVQITGRQLSAIWLGCFRAAGCHIGSSRRYNRPQIFSSQDAFVLVLAANFQDVVGFSRRLGLRFLSSQDAFVLLSGRESSRMYCRVLVAFSGPHLAVTNRTAESLWLFLAHVWP